MKRYLVFYGDDYYPSGGMDDFIGDFDTINEGIEALKIAHQKHRPDDPTWDYAWGNIWDSLERTQVWDQTGRNS